MMRHNLIPFSVCIILRLDSLSSVFANSCTDKSEERGSAVLSFELDNNFETGVLQPWVEESQASARWKIENKSSPWEPTNPSPRPPEGNNNYLRVHREASLSFGVAVLRSPTFTLLPNENYNFSFSFWIRSKWPKFTNLELNLSENGNEKLLLSLHNYSNIANLSWQTQSVSLIGDSSSTLSLVFYAYCGTDIEDAVAIDDISFTSTPQWTTLSPAATDFTTQLITTTSQNKDTFTTKRPLPTTSRQQTPTISTSTTLSTTPSTTTTATSLKPEFTSTSSTSTTVSAPTELITTTISKTDSNITTSTPESTTLLTMACETMTTLSTDFTCPYNIEFKYPDPKNPCSKIYYQCFECVATEKQCMKNQVFSNQTQSCRPCVQVPSCSDECRD